MLVDGFLRGAAEQSPDRTALVCGGSRLTFAALDSAADRFAVGLADLGVRRGDRVVLYLDNRADAVIAICGAMRAGAVFVPVNATIKAEKLRYLLRDCEAAVLVSDSRKMPVVSDAIADASTRPTLVLSTNSADGGSGGSEPSPETPVLDAIPFDALLASPTDRSRADDRIDLDLVALIYTSGSSGRPKGVMLSHANVVAATLSINAYLKNTPQDVILDVLPLSFDYGLYQLFLAFNAGATVVLERSFTYLKAILDLMVRERVTGFPIVPMIAALLARHDLAAADLSSLRYITNTGAVLPPAHIATLRERLPHVRIFSMYGLTECKRVSFLPPEDIDERPTSVGKPMENVEVFVADQEGRLSATGEGELVIRGSNVMQGYWRAPDETRRVFRAGGLPGQHLLYSGDLFRIDADGYMYFQRRLDDVIKSRAQRVSPKEVENVLYELRGVTAAAVVGIEDPVLGAAIKAFLCVDPSMRLSKRDVLRHCVERLEDFMVPKIVEFVDTLPRTESGKIMRHALRDCTDAGASTPA